MACPLFQPGAILRDVPPQSWPLGDAYAGTCAARPNEIVPADTLRSCCNLGYARHACPAASQIEADAVRFLIKADHGGAVEIAWSLERDHHPVRVGTVEFEEETAATTPFDFQVRAYRAAYSRQVRK